MENTQVCDSTQVQNTPEPETRRVIKKKILKVKKSEPTEESTTAPSNDAVGQSEDEKDLSSIIPSSRIKNYINKEKLNKEIDSIIEKIKSSDASLDLNSILSEDTQKKIGSAIKEKEKNNQEKPDTATAIVINDIAVDILSKQRFKFSNNSFKVLSVFSDMIIEEITRFAMDELVKNKKSIINNKYVFNDQIKNGRLYRIYSELPSFIAMRNEMQSTDVVEVSDSTDVVEDAEAIDVAEASSSDEKTPKTINFEFYIKKICNKLKVSDDMYSKIKVSDKYQKFCSSIILDFLNKVAPLSKILLDIMTTKTITNLVFQTIIKMQVLDSDKYDEIMADLNQRLDSHK